PAKTMAAREASRRSFGRRPVGYVASAIAPDANVGLFGMPGKSFQHAESGAVFSDPRRCGVVEHSLVGHRLQEFADPQTTCVAGRLLGRQRVVGADDLV